MTSESPPSLGGFTLIDRIGKGGMGEVWRAERIGPAAIRRRAAVKRILPVYQHDAVLRERFLAEARITARLEHPNVVQLLDFGDQPEWYLVLEYIDGVPLTELLRAASKGNISLPVPAALFIAAEVATGLDYAHRRTDEAGQALGIVHRDVSPPNILISTDGSVKIGDFGIARAADNSLRTVAGAALGKIVYMAPEQMRGEPLDRRADIFALGIVLWESLTLRPLLPRDAPDRTIEALERCDFPSPSSLMRGIPPAVDELVRDALSADQSKRTSSASKFARAVRSALHTLAPGFDSRDLAQIVRQLVPDGAHGPLEGITPPVPTAFAIPPTAASETQLPLPPTPTPQFALPQQPAPIVPVAMPFAQKTPLAKPRGRVALIIAISLVVLIISAAAVYLITQTDLIFPDDETESQIAHTRPSLS